MTVFAGVRLPGWHSPTERLHMTPFQVAQLRVASADEKFELARDNLTRISNKIQDLQDARDVYFSDFQRTMNELVEAQKALALETGNF
jgi:predicted translin family RNA/ssDNA-binding protein